MTWGGRLACALAIGVLSAASAAGADYYVATTGSDSGTGSESSPWRTISKALATVNDGDTILILTGAYDFPSPPPKNRTTDYVTLKPAPGHDDQVTINGYVRPYSNSDYLRFQNLKFGTGLHFDNVSHFQVRGCSAPGSATLYGIKVTGNDILIEGNIISGGAKAYVFGGQDIIVRWNEAYDTTSDGFFMGSASNVLFEGNYFHDNHPSPGAHPDFFQVYGGTPTTVSNVTIRRNYFDTEGQGIFWERYEGTITNVLVENNIIISTLARAWSCQTTGGPVICRNNTFMFPPEQGLSDPMGGGALCYMDNWSGGTYVFANNTCRYISRPSNVNFIGRNYIIHEFTAVDPGSFNAPPTTYFHDFTNHDFRLKAGGPAVDAGDPTYASTTDILGRTRDAQPDIGAYEYNAADSASLESLFVAILRAEQTAIRGGSVPPDLAVTGWAVAADHGLAGTLETAVADGYTESRLAGFGQIKIAFSRAVDPTTLTAGAVTIVGDAHGDVSDHIQSLTLESGGTVLTVALSSSLPDADTYTITVTDVLRSAASGSPVSGDADVSLRVLGGDVDGSGAVTAADLLAVRTAAGQAVTGATASLDVDGSGVITTADVMRARGRLGQALP